MKTSRVYFIIYFIFTIGCEAPLEQNNSPSSDSTNVSSITPTQATPTAQASATPSSVVATKLASGGTHVCAIVNEGAVKCWGNGYSGQLGNGKTGTTQTHTPIPVDVTGINLTAKAITAGKNHTCVLTSQNGIKCWGVNADGQLGDGTFTNRSTPVDVSGLTSDVVAISASLFNTCALTTTGTVKCWGKNSFGQIGDGTTTTRNLPTNVLGLPDNIKAIATSGLTNCAVNENSGVLCWGDKDAIGNEVTQTFSTIPIAVTGLSSGVSVLAGGDLSFFAVMNDGGVKSWGADGNGQQGDGLALGPKRKIPDYVSGIGPGSGASDLSTMGAGTHTCVIFLNSPLKCWGQNGNSQASADGSVSNAQPPSLINNIAEKVIGVATGATSTCVIIQGGTVKCWGKNNNGQLGDGTLNEQSLPVNVVF